MNREQVAKILPLLQAFMEGKTLQYNHPGDGWDDVKTPNIDSIVVVPERWRIKPEPRRFTVMVSTDKHPDGTGRVVLYRPDIHDTCKFISYGWWEKVEVVEDLDASR